MFERKSVRIGEEMNDQQGDIPVKCLQASEDNDKTTNKTFHDYCDQSNRSPKMINFSTNEDSEQHLRSLRKSMTALMNKNERLENENIKNTNIIMKYQEEFKKLNKVIQDLVVRTQEDFTTVRNEINDLKYQLDERNKNINVLKMK